MKHLLKHPTYCTIAPFMKQAVSALLGLMILTQCTTNQVVTTTTPVRTNEVRGVWITNIDSEVMFSKQATAKAIDYLADNGFNVVFPVVWNDGYTLFPSRTMETYFGPAFKIDTLFQKQGRDPLAELIVEAHRRGLEVIPWFEFGFSSSINQKGGHILKKYPHWSALDAKGGMLTKNGFEWMNSFDPEVQQFVTELVMEVPKHYDVDGVQGDDRLPSLPAEGGYEPKTRQAYQEATGQPVPELYSDSLFMRWKADQLSAYGKRLYDTVKAFDPSLIVSYSPIIYPWGYDHYLQDWPAWVRGGYVDLLIPQSYRYDVSQFKATTDEIVGYAKKAGLEKTTLAIGILTKSGPRYNGPEYVKQALAHNRAVGSAGEVFFFYEGMNQNNAYLADTLHATYYAQPATLPYRKGSVRRKPAVIVDESKASYTGTWSPKSSEQAFDGQYREGSGSVKYTFVSEEAARYEVYIHIPYGMTLLEVPKTAITFGNHTDGFFRNDEIRSKLEGWVRIGEVTTAAQDWVYVQLSSVSVIPADGVMFLKKLNKPQN